MDTQTANMPSTEMLEEFLKNFSPIVTKTLKEAVEDYFQARALSLSSFTIADYRIVLRRLCEMLPDDPPVCEIDPKQIRYFLLNYPAGDKTKFNAWITLKSFWRWCVIEQYASKNIMDRVEKPRFKKIQPEPFQDYEIERLFKALDKDKSQDYLRDVAILSLMLDTGLRASELCGVQIGDIHGEMFKVFGKGYKERLLPLSSATLQAIANYMLTRPGAWANKEAYLFLSYRGDPMNRNSLRLLFDRLGVRTGIKKCHAHKCRHTFAINYIRNGGDAYTLQQILGHSTLDMVKKYLAIAQSEVLSRHKTASPMTHWKAQGKYLGKPKNDKKSDTFAEKAPGD